MPVRLSRDIREVPQIPRFPPAPTKSTPSSTFYSIRTCEKEKMSQFLSHNTGSFNTSYTAVSVSTKVTVVDDRSNILAWLSTLDSKSRHQDIQDRRVESIGEWLLRTEVFRSWHAGSGED